MLGEALGGGHSQNKGLSEAEPRLPLILRMPFPTGFTVRKAQLLNILNLKSSSYQRRNFHGYNMPSEYTVKMTALLYKTWREQERMEQDVQTCQWHSNGITVTWLILHTSASLRVTFPQIGNSNILGWFTEDLVMASQGPKVIRCIEEVCEKKLI